MTTTNIDDFVKYISDDPFENLSWREIITGYAPFAFRKKREADFFHHLYFSGKDMTEEDVFFLENEAQDIFRQNIDLHVSEKRWVKKWGSAAPLLDKQNKTPPPLVALGVTWFLSKKARLLPLNEVLDNNGCYFRDQLLKFAVSEGNAPFLEHILEGRTAKERGQLAENGSAPHIINYASIATLNTAFPEIVDAFLKKFEHFISYFEKEERNLGDFADLVKQSKVRTMKSYDDFLRRTFTDFKEEQQKEILKSLRTCPLPQESFLSTKRTQGFLQENIHYEETGKTRPVKGKRI